MPDIDVVVMWVDGSDPVWISEKRKFEKPDGKDRDGVFLFRDYGLMNYWFRSVEAYLPWVRKIHFVTWGHLPSFLDTSNPKLNIVRHQDYMPEGSLPCYNSSALEMNLFRIKDLSEHFIYFNDDIFVLRPMDKSCFFTNKGEPCCQYTEMPPIHKGVRGVWQSIYVNDMSIINSYFDKQQCLHGRLNQYFNLKYKWYDNVRSLSLKFLFPYSFTGFKIYHVCAPFCKKTFQTIWEREPDLLTETSCHKFRDYRDVNQWLAIMWQLAEGNFHPRRMNALTVGVNSDNVDDVCTWIINQKYETLCINDGAQEIDFPNIAKKLQDAFDIILPNKCSFEK